MNINSYTTQVKSHILHLLSHSPQIWSAHAARLPLIQHWDISIPTYYPIMSRRSGRKTAYEKGDPKSDANSAEIDEQEEVTRCVCGNDELAAIDALLVALLQTEYHLKVDTGLFIQCEKCLVWQHGYCVGLFASEDVPDKYWCEECKPELHRMVEDASGAVRRTLYRSVNDSRKVLLESSSVDPAAAEKTENGSGSESKPLRLRSRRSPQEMSPDDGGRDSDTSNVSTRQSRKDRRHGDPRFDEQLQKALRESSRGSKKGDDEAAEKRAPSEELEHDEVERDVKKETRTKPRARPKPKQAKPRTLSKAEEVSKDELLSQLSRPRFVDEKLTIYELRKRTGAILEWLGRTQMELEEERDTKRRHVGGAVVLPLYDDNLRLMENLTEKILSWEQRFGKYAP